MIWMMSCADMKVKRRDKEIESDNGIKYLKKPEFQIIM
jgi:hypothetical protein